MSHTQNAVKVQVNESALIRNLGAVFTNKTKVLSELLQNGRRAGATSISITFDDVSKTLVVTDDGCGIQEMQNLLTVADSGWDTETCSNESPFGMGFLSTLFTAKSVKVESKGKQIAFSTADAINMHSIAVESSDFFGGTRVTLCGFEVSASEIEDNLISGSDRARGYASGFPLPIFYNGTELERPEAVDDRFIDCEIGKIRLFAQSSSSTKMNFQWSAPVFLQGLPVSAGSGLSHTVVHLNGEFMARMPDRDVLLNVGEASKRIAQAVIAEYRKHFEALKATDPMQLFDEDNYTFIKMFDLLDLLNDIDVLPARLLKKYDDYPQYDSNMRALITNGDNITRDQLESGEVMLLRSDLNAGDFGAHTMALAMLAWKLELPILRVSLHPEHWAQKMGYPTQVELDNDAIFDANVVIEYTTIKPGENITLVDNYTVSYHGKSYTFADDAVSVGNFGFEESDLIVPTGEHSASVLSQFNDWESDDVFDERWRDEEEDSFLRQLAILRGEDAAVTLRKVFEWKDINNENLVGKSFTVVFVDEMRGDFLSRSVVVTEIVQTQP